MIKFVYQNLPRGTGDAVLKCKNLIKSKYFLMLMPDDLIIQNNCSLSMIKLHNKYKSSVIASKKVNRRTVSRWGIFDFKKINKRNFLIKDVIEKPSVESAPSNYAVIGRYILPTKIFKILEKQTPGQNGEIHITDSIRTLIHQKNKFIGSLVISAIPSQKFPPIPFPRHQLLRLLAHCISLPRLYEMVSPFPHPGPG